MGNPLIKEDEATTNPETAAPAKNERPTPKSEMISKENEKLRAEIEALKSGNKKFEEDTLRAALGKAGISLEQFVATQEINTRSKDILEVDIGRQVVSINGIPYTGVVRGDRGMIEMVQSLAGNERMARLRELVGKDFIVESVSSGGIRAKHVNTHADLGVGI